MKIDPQNPNTPALWDKILFERDTELLNSPYYLDKLNKVAGFLKNKEGKFLDIGFGMANLEKKITEQNTSLEMYGIDFSPKAVARAKKQINGKFYVSYSKKMPFKKSFFDYTAMLDVLEHIPKSESEKVLGEINRVMKKDGVFIVSVPLNEDLDKMNKDGKNLNEHLREYTPKILEKELNLSGFKVFKRELIYAFKTQYFLKNKIAKLFPNLKKPNVLIFYSQKK